MSEPLRCIVLGAGGRDFHDIQTFFRERPEFRVVALTAAQIPFIECRTFPKELAGPLYDADIPIYSEDELATLIARLDVDFVFLAYSDLSHEDVMHKASLVQACGAGFALLLSPAYHSDRSACCQNEWMSGGRRRIRRRARQA